MAACAGRVPADPGGAPAQQGDRADGIAAPGVGQADRQLGQALPQVALSGRSGLPGRLQDLMGMERAPGVQQPLRGVQGRGRGQRGHVRHGRLAVRAALQRAPEAVPRPRVPGPPGRVPVPVSPVPVSPVPVSPARVPPARVLRVLVPVALVPVALVPVAPGRPGRRGVWSDVPAAAAGRCSPGGTD